MFDFSNIFYLEPEAKTKQIEWFYPRKAICLTLLIFCLFFYFLDFIFALCYFYSYLNTFFFYFLFNCFRNCICGIFNPWTKWTWKWLWCSRNVASNLLSLVFINKSTNAEKSDDETFFWIPLSFLGTYIKCRSNKQN